MIILAISLVNIFGTAPYCTDNQLSLSCYYYSAQACAQAANQIGTVCVLRPQTADQEPRRRRGRK